jgi:hypothetical protein
MLHHVALGRTEEILCHIVFLRSMLQMLVTADIPSSPVLVTLMMETILSYKTLVLTRATWCNIPEDGILQSLYLAVFNIISEIVCAELQDKIRPPFCSSYHMLDEICLIFG